MPDTAAASYPFTDPVTGGKVTVHFGDTAGVEHPNCDYRAEVVPDLDAFFCRHCGRNGRISGVWFLELLDQHPTGATP